MLDYLKNILENRQDAYVRAISAADAHIAKSGGNWYGTGIKGCILLLQSSRYQTYEDGLHYILAGRDLLNPALDEARLHTGIEVDFLNFVSGCGFAASARHPGHYEKAKAQFALNDGSDDGFEPWCSEWRSILMSVAARANDRPDEAKAFYQELSLEQPERAVQLFELWHGRQDGT